MKKAWVNYWVDMITGVAFLLCAVTGVVFLFFPGLVSVSGGDATILGVSSAAWHWVHDWSGVVMTAGVGLHTVLHLRWLVKMTRKLGAGDEARIPGAAGSGRERARIVSPGAQPYTGVTVAAASAAASADSQATALGSLPSASASLERQRSLVAEPHEEESHYSRKAFLTGAAAVGGAALLVGVGLNARSNSTATVTTSTGNTASADGSGGGNGYGQGADPSSSSPGSSAGSSAGTATSDRVVVSSSCVGCGHCLQACRYGVFGWGSDGKVYAASPDACALCGSCLQVCPASAITLNG